MGGVSCLRGSGVGSGRVRGGSGRVRGWAVGEEVGREGGGGQWEGSGGLG